MELSCYEFDVFVIAGVVEESPGKLDTTSSHGMFLLLFFFT